MTFIKIGADQYNLGDIAKAVEEMCEAFIAESDVKFDKSLLAEDASEIKALKSSLLMKMVDAVEDDALSIGEKIYLSHHLTRAKAVDLHLSHFSKHFLDKTDTKKFFNKLRESLLDEVRAAAEDDHKAMRKILSKRAKLILKIKRKC